MKDSLLIFAFHFSLFKGVCMNGKILQVLLVGFGIGLWMFSLAFFYFAVIYRSAALGVVQAGCMLGAVMVQVLIEKISAQRIA